MRPLSTSMLLVSLVLASLAASPVRAAQAEPLEALAQMPIREVSIFKDGHAFVRHEGSLPTDAAGNVLMDYLPTPVMGAFWPYSADQKIRLTSVVAGQRKVLVPRTALSIRELIESNIGAGVVITESPVGQETQRVTYEATIVGVPVRSGEEMEKTAPPNSGEMLPQKGNLVLLKTAEGTKVVDINRIQDVTFRGDVKPTATSEEMRNLLTLKLDWRGARPSPQAAVGMVYLQRGLRWIPSYKVTIDGQGKAHVALEATLINELADLDDVTARLVIGVPTFKFEGQVDPIALQQTLADLSGFFRRREGGRAVDYLSNAVMSQRAQVGYDAYDRAGGESQPDLGPEVVGGQQTEDLFVFTVEHVTLKKGQRMVIPVKEFDVNYRDVYTLDIPFAPPPEVRARFNSSQLEQLAALIEEPKVMHVLRIENKSDVPLTTAPALILSGDSVLAQGLMTYTSAGGECDLPVTAAVDIKMKKSDEETQRTPNAVTWQGDQYGRVDLKGAVTLTNYRKQPAQVEVTRNVLGNVTSASNDGKITMVNVFEDNTFGSSAGLPVWWRWYGWPYWWYHFNSIGRIKWVTTIEPGKSVDLTYEWHYYWR